MPKNFYIILLWFALFLQKMQGQFLLNGSFEGASLECGIDLLNQTFTDEIPQVVGFGELGELDILTGTCGFGPPPHGDYFVSLTCREGVTDAIALQLSEPFPYGKAYSISFFAKIAATNDPEVRLSLGFTGPPTSHGELLHTVFDLTPVWKKYSHNFTAVPNFDYVSVILETRGEATVLVDNFNLYCPALDLGPDLTFCEITSLDLQASPFFQTYLWSDQSTSSILSVDEPGLYWVEAGLGDCIARDSLFIFEDPKKCKCDEVYLPNAFSPNGDGVNETWQPLTPCELTDYKLVVFNKWGSMVFYSEDPTEAWDGNMGGKYLPAENYAYRLQYRFWNSTEGQVLGGIVHLLR